jgi:NitT/TauT family transport system substrate-binding protein
MNSRRWTFLIAAAAAIGFSTAGFAKEKLSLATYLEPAHYSALWPLISGKIKSDKLKIEVKSLPVGVAGQAMATKQYDVFGVGALALQQAATQGLKLQMIATDLRYKPAPLGFGIWVKKDSPIKTVDDLKGKTVGSYGFKSTVFALQRMALNDKYHVNVAINGGDFKFVQLPAPNLPGALLTGRVDAATFSHLQSYDARMGKDFRLLVDTGHDFQTVYKTPMITSIYVGYPEKLNAKPELYQEMLRMMRASTEYTLSHQDEVFTAVSEKTKVPKAFFFDWWKNYGIFPVSISQGDIKAMKVLYKKAIEFGMVNGMPDLSKAVWDKALRE